MNSSNQSMTSNLLELLHHEWDGMLDGTNMMTGLSREETRPLRLPGGELRPLRLPGRECGSHSRIPPMTTMGGNLDSKSHTSPLELYDSAHMSARSTALPSLISPSPSSSSQDSKHFIHDSQALRHLSTSLEDKVQEVSSLGRPSYLSCGWDDDPIENYTSEHHHHYSSTREKNDQLVSSLHQDHDRPSASTLSLFQSLLHDSLGPPNASQFSTAASLSDLLSLTASLTPYSDCLTAFSLGPNQVLSCAQSPSAHHPLFPPPSSSSLSPRLHPDHCPPTCFTTEGLGAALSDSAVSLNGSKSKQHRLEEHPLLSMSCSLAGLGLTSSSSPSSSSSSKHEPESKRAVVGGADFETEFFMRKLGGFRNIGWTLNRRTNEYGQIEHQALVYSLQIFHSYCSPWMVDENEALKAALTLCYEAEKGDHDCTSDKGTTAMTAQSDAVSPGPTSPSITFDVTDSSPVTSPSSDAQENILQNPSSIASSLSVSRRKSLASNPLHDHPARRMNHLSMHWMSGAMYNSPHRSRHSCSSEQFISSDPQTVVLAWVSQLPNMMTPEMVVSIWRSLLPPSTRLLGMLTTPTPSEGVLIFQDLSSAIEFIRTAKSKQLEYFDLLVAGDRQAASSSFFAPDYRSLLFHPVTGNAIGFGLVNISPHHPTYIHTLLRLSQKDAVALGHKRTSTETLRLLLTHPEVSPVMVVPPAQPFGSFSLGRATPLSQTPSHRRATIWCALCCSQSSDIPGAWKHLSRNPHEALRDVRNATLLEWVAQEHPELSAVLMVEDWGFKRRMVELPGSSNVEVTNRLTAIDGATAFSMMQGFEERGDLLEDDAWVGLQSPNVVFQGPHRQKQNSTRSYHRFSTSRAATWSPERFSANPTEQQDRGQREENCLKLSPKTSLNPEAPAFVPSHLCLSACPTTEAREGSPEDQPRWSSIAIPQAARSNDVLTSTEQE